MATRDWDKELAMIDRQLAALSDDQIGATATAPPRPAVPSAPSAPAAAATSAPPVQRAVPTAASAAPSAAMPASVTFVHGTQPRTWKSRAIVLGKLALAGAMAAAVSPLVWPFEFRCGADLGLYLGAIAAATLTALWAARSSWRHRAGFAHTASLLLVLWGVALGSWLALPRVGLGLPDAQRITVWQCR